MLTELLVCVIILYCVLFYFENFVQNKNRPPGPLLIPPFGNLIQVAFKHKVGHIALHKLAKKYGDIMSIKMGTVDTVILSSYDVVRSVYTKEEASGRHCSGIVWDRNLKQNIGLAFGNGPQQIETRKFCRNTLKTYGYGDRKTMENLLLDEVNSEFMASIEEESKQNLESKVHFEGSYYHKCFLNIMVTWMLGKRFRYDDANFLAILDAYEKMAHNGLLGTGIMLAFPILRIMFPEALGYNAQLSSLEEIRSVVMALFHERRNSGLYKIKSESFLDTFLNELDQKSTNSNMFFSEDQFLVIFSDIVEAGSDTTGNVVNFIMLHLIANPAIQEKVYQEILAVIGYSRLPSIEDRSLMPYTQAVILEGLRWSRVAVMGAPRVAMEDFTYKNYEIKKGTVLMHNLQRIFFNKKIWGDPKIFRPERFFTMDKNLDTRKLNIIQAIFGAGRRVCFGEGFARDSLFIFVTSLIQKFKFSLPEGSNPSLEPLIGIALYPAPYDAIVTLREHVD